MRPRILIVDDDQEIFDILAAVLEPEGFEVHWARNQEEFSQKAFSHPFRLIMLDIMLGNENGPDVYKHLLNRGLARQIPVIFISSLIQNHSPRPVESGRLYAMHPKPFDFERLLNDIRVLLAMA